MSGPFHLQCCFENWIFFVLIGGSYCLQLFISIVNKCNQFIKHFTEGKGKNFLIQNEIPYIFWVYSIIVSCLLIICWLHWCHSYLWSHELYNLFSMAFPPFLHNILYMVCIYSISGEIYVCELFMGSLFTFLGCLIYGSCKLELLHSGLVRAEGRKIQLLTWESESNAVN